ncbi:MAG TPA: homocysteine S-methyltransferase family protein [Candidatus Limnocylindrales bacterium]
MQTLLERLSSGGVLVSDGATGSLLQSAGLPAGASPESWCLSRPEVVRGVAEAYLAAGSDMVLTNSFGGSPLKLARHGLAERAGEVNRVAATLAREAAGSGKFVAGSVGPTGRIVWDEGGDATPAELYEAFREQVQGLADGGADAICVETMSSLAEALEAVRASKEHTTLPVFCTFSFALGRRGFRTMMGVSPEVAALEAAAAGADVIGTNCGNGIENMIEIVRQMHAAVPDRPILAQANAGMPELVDGVTIYPETPEYMSSRVGELIAAGATIVGGCCGTTPQHMAAIAEAVRGR